MELFGIVPSRGSALDHFCCRQLVVTGHRPAVTEVAVGAVNDVQQEIGVIPSVGVAVGRQGCAVGILAVGTAPRTDVKKIPTE